MSDAKTPSGAPEPGTTQKLQHEAQRLADAARDRAGDAVEELKVASNQVVDKVRDLIEEGNVRRVSIKKGDRTLLEIPLTVGVGAGAGAVLLNAPLAAIGALAALVADITLVVERDPEAEAKQRAHDALAETDAADGEHVHNVGPGAAGGSADADKTVGKPPEA